MNIKDVDRFCTSIPKKRAFMAPTCLLTRCNDRMTRERKLRFYHSETYLDTTKCEKSKRYEISATHQFGYRIMRLHSYGRDTINWHGYHFSGPTIPLAIKNLPGSLFIRTFLTEEFLHPLTYVRMLETVCMKLYVRSRHAWYYGNIKLSYNCIYIYNKSH